MTLDECMLLVTKVLPQVMRYQEDGICNGLNRLCCWYESVFDENNGATNVWFLRLLNLN